MFKSSCLIGYIFILAAVYAGNIFAQPKLFIKNGQEDYSLGKYISILEDKESKLNIYEAASDSMKNRYVYFKKGISNLGFTFSAFWIRFVIVDTLPNNASVVTVSQNSSTWLLIRNDPVLEDLRLYYRDRHTDKTKYIEKKAGSILSLKDKPIKTNDFIADFPVSKDVSDTIYLRVMSRSQVIISFNLLTTGQYILLNSQKNLFQGLLFGIFILLIVYNTILYFSMKKKVYLFYVLYIASFAFFIFTFQGAYAELIGYNFFRSYFILPLGSVTLAAVFWLLLTREFLSTELYLPWAYKLLTYITPLGLIICASIFVFAVPRLTVVLTTLLLTYFIIGCVIAIITLKKGVFVSRYYLIAVGGLIFGIFISASARNNFLRLPWNFWTLNALGLGVLWEALILAAAVGYQFTYIRTEKEKEKALMRNQIAADLHDEIGSNLGSISLQSKMMMKSNKLDENSKNQLKEISNIAGITTETIRDIVWFINPFHDKSIDLLIRMKELASKMLINLNYTFSVHRNDERIFDSLPDLSKRRHVYLIFKESLNNILKHSEADEVKISLSKKSKKFILVIADDGKGFNEDEIVHGEGLRNLRNRAVQAGAQLLIESDCGKGTKITLRVPLG